MTAAAKLRELLATRPVCPGLVELVRWWLTSAELVPQVLDQLENDTCARHAGKAHGAEAEELRRGIDHILKRGYGSTQAMYQALQRMLDEVSAHDSLAYLEDREAAIDVLKQEVRELEQQRDAVGRQRLEVCTSMCGSNECRIRKQCTKVDCTSLYGQLDYEAWDTAMHNVGALTAERDQLRAELERKTAPVVRGSFTEGPVDDPHDDESRCAVCGWQMPDPVKGTAGFPCRPGDCSMRPRPDKLYAPERAAKEASHG